MSWSSGDPGEPALPAMARVRALLSGLGCSPAEVLALAILTAGAVVGLALLWGLSRPAGDAAGALVALPAGETPSPAGATAPNAATNAPSPGSVAGTAEPGAAADGATTSGPAVVHVAGEVRRPGVYTVPPGSRVADAVRAAGGALPSAQLDAVNLARPVTDGEQLLIPDEYATPPPVPPPQQPEAGTPAPATPLDLNLATAAQLEELPGIGPVMAERILAHREAIGGFRSVEELQDVPGVGEKTFAALAELVTV